MKKITSGTASRQLSVDGAYVEFQLAVLRALPRDIDPKIASKWQNDGKGLTRTLRALLAHTKPTTEATPVVKAQIQPLLIPVGTIIVKATKNTFIAKDNFVVNTRKNTSVKISSLGTTSKNGLLRIRGNGLSLVQHSNI